MDEFFKKHDLSKQSLEAIENLKNILLKKYNLLLEASQQEKL